LAPETLTREGHTEVMTKPHQMGAPLWVLVSSPFKGTLFLFNHIKQRLEENGTPCLLQMCTVV